MTDPLLSETQPEAGSAPAGDAESIPAGARIGPYRVLEEIGRGGMGTVYLAERADGAFEQRVALKRIRLGLGTELLRDRFLRERQILAGLEHPNIARLLDGGVDAGGRPYFALELVEGVPLTAYCDERRLPIPQRVDLFLQACRAVQHAHARLVVHRDLKPSNMLVAGDGTLKLLDFGIAKVLSDEAPDATALTRAGVQPLTPEYAAPEQWRGEPVTAATDVYVLGVVLHELLTGRRPPRPAGAGGDDGGAREPETPSATVTRPLVVPGAPGTPPSELSPAAVAARRGTTPDRLRRALAGDLEAIVLQALHAEPGERYLSVEALAEDLRRHRSGQPVRARPATLGYRAAKLLRRHRVGFAAAAAALVSLLVGLGASLWQARVAARERDRAAAAAAEAEEVADYLVDLFGHADPEHGEGGATTARELLDRGAARLEETLGDRPVVRARLQEAIARVYYHQRLLEPAASLLEKAIAAREREQGASHPDLLGPLLDLGAVRYRGYQYDLARATLERAMAIAESLPVEQRGEVGRGLTLLGNLYLGERSWAAAEREYRRALARFERSDPAGEIERTPTLNNLGVALFEQGRLAEAEAVHAQVLALREREHGATHHTVAQSLVNLANVAVARRDAAAAAPLVERSLAIREAIYGRDHPAVAEALALRADVADLRGDPRAAEADLREALRICEATQGFGHPETAWTRLKLATRLLREGRLDEAAPVAETALVTLRAAEGADPLDRQRALAVVVELRLRRGDVDDALAAMRDAADRDSDPPVAPPDLDSAVEAFAARLASQGLDQEAARMRAALALPR